ncbi:hypothetical protein SCHPADRAFT_941673 [Schizopora paradoxa]|uniref:Uncharacterized protein n=1 Tax=Schizopora paradoxa TaxID=27342 RepID=A0A0H2RR78_9AGAM|nr:hypothetical protein SCHPADRAFT_941673 [Schizopora paradoxa]
MRFVNLKEILAPVELEYTINGEEETDECLLKVIPVAGNLRLHDGRYTRVNATMHFGPKQNTADHGELHLVLHGSMFEGKNQSALLRFLCNHTVEEPSSIAFSSANDELRVFAWASRHACATRIGDVLPT